MFAAISLSNGSVIKMNYISTVEGKGSLEIIQAEIDKLPDEVKSQVASFREVLFSDFPDDDTFRDAWTDTGSTIEVDMVKARGIWRDKMREARTPKLISLDVAFQRAFEVGADLTVIYAQKQALRDVTADTAIEAAQTASDLKKIWPDILN
jgi:hypothetical protein